MLVAADESEVSAALVRVLLELVAGVDDRGGQVDARVLRHQIGMAVVGLVDLGEVRPGSAVRKYPSPCMSARMPARAGRVQEPPESADPAPGLEQPVEAGARALRHRVDHGVQPACARAGEQVELDAVVAARIEHPAYA